MGCYGLLWADQFVLAASVSRRPGAWSVCGEGTGMPKNKVQYVRGVTWREDASQCWVGLTAHAVAALRNGQINRLRQAGWANIAAALRHFGANCQPAHSTVHRPAVLTVQPP